MEDHEWGDILGTRGTTLGLSVHTAYLSANLTATKIGRFQSASVLLLVRNLVHTNQLHIPLPVASRLHIHLISLSSPENESINGDSILLELLSSVHIRRE